MPTCSGQAGASWYQPFSEVMVAFFVFTVMSLALSICRQDATKVLEKLLQCNASPSGVIGVHQDVDEFANMFLMVCGLRAMPGVGREGVGVGRGGESCLRI